MRTFSTSRKHFIAGSSALLAVTACSGGGSRAVLPGAAGDSVLADLQRLLPHATIRKVAFPVARPDGSRPLLYNPGRDSRVVKPSDCQAYSSQRRHVETQICDGGAGSAPDTSSITGDCYTGDGWNASSYGEAYNNYGSLVGQAQLGSNGSGGLTYTFTGSSGYQVTDGVPVVTAGSAGSYAGVSWDVSPDGTTSWLSGPIAGELTFSGADIGISGDDTILLSVSPQCALVYLLAGTAIAAVFAGAAIGTLGACSGAIAAKSPGFCKFAVGVALTSAVWTSAQIESWVSAQGC